MTLASPVAASETAPSIIATSTTAGRPMVRRDTVRNIAVIAHVDHGKTTLVDGLLKQSKVFRDAAAADAAGELIMDSNVLERERGITVFAKNAAIRFGEIKINLVDTPGHADFSSEVERTLSMADGCLLLVDAAEGPLPQTRFVLGLALQLGLRPLVVVNKVDRKDARPEEVVSEVEELFLELAQDDSQLHYPVIYAIAREGRAGPAPDQLAPDLGPLFKAIVEHVPAPVVDLEGPAQLLVSALDYDPHRGRIAVGRLVRGRLARGMSIRRLGEQGASSALKLTELFVFQGLSRLPVDGAEAGDIAALAGIPDIAIGDTIADADAPEALPRLAITEPTVQLTMLSNTSPFAGQDGKAVTSRQLHERLERELETNVGLRVHPDPTGQGFIVAGRGELHLAILLETLRREGLEFAVSRPEVILKREDGRTLEPIEEVVITVPQTHVGTVTELIGPRQAQLVHMTPDEGRGARLVYRVPTRGLIGLRGGMLTATRGTATVTSRFLEYAPMGGEIPRQRNGAVIATEAGPVTAYSIANAQERTKLFVSPGDMVYEGMVVGINSRENDMPVNIVKEKKLPNSTGYNETCAQIGNVLWNWRLLHATADSQYADLIEHTLFNSVISGIGLDGKSWFYTNPLRWYGQDQKLLSQDAYQRFQPGLVHVCCPSNLVRTVAGVRNYAYSTSDEGLWVHLYGASEASLGGFTLRQETDYPWSGTITFTIDEAPAEERALFLRIPAWARDVRLTVNGQGAGTLVEPGTYARVQRRWHPGDRVELEMPLRVRLVEGNPRIEATRNQVAVFRGPLVYCLESPDLPHGVEIEDVYLPPDVDLQPRHLPDELNGVTVLEGEADVIPEPAWSGALYRELDRTPPQRRPIRLIPYYAWANRGISEMTVWLPLSHR